MKKIWYADPRPVEVLFGDRLMKIMADQETSAIQMQRDGVCSHTLIGKYRKHESAPNSYILKNICQYFDVSADYMLGLSDSRGDRFKWQWIDGECRCGRCGNRGETTYVFCPYCGERLVR